MQHITGIGLFHYNALFTIWSKIWPKEKSHSIHIDRMMFWWLTYESFWSDFNNFNVWNNIHLCYDISIVWTSQNTREILETTTSTITSIRWYISFFFLKQIFTVVSTKEMYSLIVRFNIHSSIDDISAVPLNPQSKRRTWIPHFNHNVPMIAYHTGLRAQNTRGGRIVSLESCVNLALQIVYW